MSVLGILALTAAAAGIVGSIVPGLPGPPVSWVGMLLAFFAVRGGDDPMSRTVLLVWLTVTIVVTVLDYAVPAWTTKATGGHKSASKGALIGLLVGIVLTPVGMILGALLGAFIGELMVTDKGVGAALKAGFGAFVGFLLGTGLKLIASVWMCYLIIKVVF